MKKKENATLYTNLDLPKHDYYNPQVEITSEFLKAKDPEAYSQLQTR